jgi:hypothetical protein
LGLAGPRAFSLVGLSNAEGGSGLAALPEPVLALDSLAVRPVVRRRSSTEGARAVEPLSAPSARSEGAPSSSVVGVSVSLPSSASK